MTLSEKLRAAAADIWESYLRHPFIREIADGSLPVEKFKYYMIQDYLYLYDYSRVFALGVVKGGDPETMRFFADFVYSTLNGEMNIHRFYMARLGISREEAENAKMALTNVSYTHYMLSEGQSGGIAELLVSILSCALSYEYIGRYLAGIDGAADNEFFGEWIRGYVSDEYTEGNKRLIEMTDRLGQGISRQEEDHLTEIFVNCSLYESRFWDMAYQMGDQVQSDAGI